MTRRVLRKGLSLGGALLTLSLLVSDRGRAVWCDEPVKVATPLARLPHFVRLRESGK